MRVQNLPPVVAQPYDGIVTGTPAAPPCPQGAGLGDGCPMVSIGNGFGTVQHADFFPTVAGLSYATLEPTQGPYLTAKANNLISRASWPVGNRPLSNMPGVDYPVGVTAGTVLKDPTAATLPNACALSATAARYKGATAPTYRINCNGYSAGSASPTGVTSAGTAATKYTVLTFDGWDFRTKSVALQVSNWKGEVVFKNNRGGSSDHAVNVNASPGAGWWTISLNNSPTDACVTSVNGCVQLYNNDFDADVAGFNGTTWGADFIALNTGFRAEYNVLTNANSRFIVTGSSHRPTLQDYCTISHNYIEGFVNGDNPLNDYSDPNNIELPLGAHGEVALVGNCGHTFMQYNTMLQPLKNGANDTGPTRKDGTGGPYANGADVSGFLFPLTGTRGPYCVRMTFSGNVGTVANTDATGTPIVYKKASHIASYNVANAPADQSSFCGEYSAGLPASNTILNSTEDGGLRLGFSDDSKLYDLNNKVFLPGHVTAISTVISGDATEGPRVSTGPQPYTTFAPTGFVESITLSEPPGDGIYNVYMTQKLPELRLDHNVGVTNFWKHRGNRVRADGRRYDRLLLRNVRATEQLVGRDR